jgi:hypothetical protein
MMIAFMTVQKVIVCLVTTLIATIFYFISCEKQHFHGKPFVDHQLVKLRSVLQFCSIRSFFSKLSLGCSKCVFSMLNRPLSHVCMPMLHSIHLLQFHVIIQCFLYECNTMAFPLFHLHPSLSFYCLYTFYIFVFINYIFLTSF